MWYICLWYIYVLTIYACFIFSSFTCTIQLIVAKLKITIILLHNQGPETVIIDLFSSLLMTGSVQRPGCLSDADWPQEESPGDAEEEWGIK